MKTKIFIIILFFCFSVFYNLVYAGSQCMNRLMSLDDPNRNPNWDWTKNITYTLQTTSGTFENIRLPYFSSQGPAAADLNTGEWDIYPEDGWKLLLRDFGPGITCPFYILYNKYRGVLRLFYFSPLNMAYTKAVAKLSFQGATTTKTMSCFTLIDEKNAFYDTYNPENSHVVIAKIGWQQWSYFDFDVSGYDPYIDSKNDPTFVIEITAVTEQDLVAKGTIDLTTTSTGAVKSSGNSIFNNVINNTFSNFDRVNKRYKTMKEFKKTIEELASENEDKWWAAPFKAIKCLTDKSWFTALGPVAGFLQFALGGGSTSSSLPTPLRTEGTVELNGKITTVDPLYWLIMRVPGSNHLNPISDSESNVLPLNDESLGIFNLISKPQINVHLELRSCRNSIRSPVCPWEIIVTSSPEQNIQFVYNDAVFQSCHAYIAHLPLNKVAKNYISVNTFNNYGWVAYYEGDSNTNEEIYYDLMVEGENNFLEFGIKAILIPIDSSPDLEPTILYKSYLCTLNYTQSFLKN